MPFEPRIVPVPDAEPELPADLAALGEELSHDAGRLAQQFPPRRVSAWRRALWRVRGWSRVVGVAAAAGVAFVGLNSYFSRPADAPFRGPGAAVPLRAGAPTVPALWFRHLTPPEREGAIDLMEDQTVQTVSVSL